MSDLSSGARYEQCRTLVAAPAHVESGMNFLILTLIA